MKLVNDAGLNLALCVDGIIQQCVLPSAGGVALVGWSLGNYLTLATMASIASVPPQSKEKLQTSIKWFIMWGSKTLFIILRYS